MKKFDHSTDIIALEAVYMYIELFAYMYMQKQRRIAAARLPCSWFAPLFCFYLLHIHVYMYVVQSLYFLNLNFQASNHLLCLYNPGDSFSSDVAQ